MSRPSIWNVIIPYSILVAYVAYRIIGRAFHVTFRRSETTIEAYVPVHRCTHSTYKSIPGYELPGEPTIGPYLINPYLQCESCHMNFNTENDWIVEVKSAIDFNARHNV